MPSQLADELLLDVEDRMEKAIVALIHEFSNVRTGRANPSLLDRIVVNYYGVETPIKQISSVTIMEGSQLYIKPYDKNLLKEAEKAILSSTLGLNPINDGVGLRLIIPQPTEQRRKELVKDVEKLGENGRISIRNIRRDGNDKIKKMELIEDDLKGYLEDIQELTNNFIKKVDEEIKIKSDELLKI
ncbi:MAG: ribosome recycling factor [Acholeplasmatales bacterium]|jgi:ribosome recycling factor|nr:ribosome recycling factor [Acholeplasmatales bacterium]